MKQLAKYIWTEEYRPETVKDIILPRNVKALFKRFVSDEEILNLLLESSTPGTGKTTTAKALCSDMGVDMLYINASKENGIDVLRTKIERFATVQSITGKPKVVVMDEIDGTTPDFQRSLRGFMDSFSHVCRFIGTCNYKSKLIDPLCSRFENGTINFNFMDKKSQAELKPKIFKRLIGILKIEKITFEEKTIQKIVDDFYPDIRRMIGIMQKHSFITNNIDNSIFETQKIDTELYEYILNFDLTSARKYIIEKGCNYSELYSDFFKNFIPLLKGSQKPKVILTLADYAYKNAFVIDKELNFSAALIEIMSDLKNE